MGTVFRKSYTTPVPAGAEIVEKNGQRFARWRNRGKLRTAPLTTGEDGGDRILVECRTFFAKYRDHDGKVVTRPTGCRDEQAARRVLADLESRAERVKAGILTPAEDRLGDFLHTPLADHIAAYLTHLRAAGAGDAHRSEVRRTLDRVFTDCSCSTLSHLISARGSIVSWLDARTQEGMSARARNSYRNAVVAFGNWLSDSTRGNRLTSSPVAKLPKASEKADPRRQRRALTEDELGQLIAVAVRRPLDDTLTIRRGKRKGERTADVRPEVQVRLELVGRERGLIYKTLVLTGLRKNELKTLTVGQLDLTPGSAFLQLDAADEKNGEGNAVTIRDDLAADLRSWLADKLAALQREARETGAAIPMRLPPDTLVFTVPAGLRLILDRDMKAAGIPKRDDRGRTVDVHALRHTFGTLLSKTGTTPRVAKEAMRHSDIKLTMNVYTDPRLLDVRGAVDRLPALPLPSQPGQTSEASRATGTDGPGLISRDDTPETPARNLAPNLAPTPYIGGHFGSRTGNHQTAGEVREEGVTLDGSACPVNEKTPVTSPVTGAVKSGWRDLNPRPPAPKAGALARLRYTPIPKAVIRFTTILSIHLDTCQTGWVHLVNSNESRNAVESGPVTNSPVPSVAT